MNVVDIPVPPSPPFVAGLLLEANTFPPRPPLLTVRVSIPVTCVTVPPAAKSPD